MRLNCLTPAEYKRYFDTIKVAVEYKYQVEICVSRMLKGITQYRVVQEETGIPWVFVALLHEMECNCDFERQILNGQLIHQRTTIVPKGCGPWKFWHSSAKEGLERYSKVINWDIGNIGLMLEAHNGFGYRKRDVLSPYLFNGCQYGGDTGFYASDGKYDPMASSQQAGAYVLLSVLVESEFYKPDLIPLFPWPVMYRAENEYIQAYQMYLNAALEPDPELVVDGIAGKKTSDIHNNLTGQYLTGDPRGEK